MLLGLRFVALSMLSALLAPAFANAVAEAPGAVDAQSSDTTESAAGTPDTLPSVEVLGRQKDLIGEAVSASEGRVGRDDIAARPRVRSGDLLELVPGMVATQHSGSGKANQYFLRGFNLDHGTDFASFVDGMPVNLRSHGHGQGYSDLNFLIPELVEQLRYRKGTYYADVGDFSAAGSAQFQIAEQLPAGILEGALGEFGFNRALLADSGRAGSTNWLYGMEAQTYDGPWQSISESVRKGNGLVRLGRDLGEGRAHLMLMGYDNRWNAPDQIPERAVEQGLVSRMGSLDTSLGGTASRYSLSGGWQGAAFGGALDAEAYWIESDFQLWSNFTYALDDPERGDQFEQFDQRAIRGLSLTQSYGQDALRWQFGLGYRQDDIDAVGLNRTQNRQFLRTVRNDQVDEQSLGVFAALDWSINEHWRLYGGVRQDWFDFDVDAGNPLNSGRRRDDMASAKLAVVQRPREDFEWYLSAGQGFHSNDARGVTLSVDPETGEPAEAADPLVRSEGAELGARLYLSERLHASLAYWHLKLDSELLFVGDAGNTEASFPSRRQGAELGLYLFPTDRFTAELEVSYTDSRFDLSAEPADAIPGAVPWVVSAGMSFETESRWALSARLRHFGQYPLIEDRSQRSNGSTTVNLRAGREWERLALHVEVLNLLGSDAHDIDYFYASRLPGEPEAGIEDIHFHPLEPRALRLSLQWRWP